MDVVATAEAATMTLLEPRAPQGVDNWFDDQLGPHLGDHDSLIT